jgi:phosphohistidine phosphatase SixA
MLFFALNLSAQAQKNKTIWVVRHAEKLTHDPKDTNPDLNEKGLQRAEDLKQYFSKKKIEKTFSTPFLRTKNTAEPLAKMSKTKIEIYETKVDADFANKIKALPNKNILIVGHSNTVLEIIKILGAKPPVQTLKDDDYDFLFEVKIKGNKAFVKTHRYGERHHSTEID